MLSILCVIALAGCAALRSAASASAAAADREIWREVAPPFFGSVTLVDGRASAPYGRLWRRRTAGGALEYRQDAESEEEFAARQW